MSPCPSRKRLLRFVDGRLGPADETAISAHLRTCPTCREFLDSLTGFEQVPDDDDDDDDDDPPPAAPDVPGFTDLSRLGRGGMGAVYRATQVQPRRTVAVKVIRGDDHPRERLRLRIEAEAIARLSHPNIVAIHLVGECDAGLFLALEFCGGGSLKDRRDGTPWPPRRAAELVATLARAVQHAHARGVVHRDLKPSNILLARGDLESPPLPQSRERGGREGAPLPPSRARGDRGDPLAGFVPKIADFGLARLLNNPAGLTPTGELLGTPAYMAPEQLGGTEPVGPAADVYALGAILYELLTGRPPHEGASNWLTAHQVRSRPPKSVRAARPSVPRDLDTVCLKCLEKEPEKRYASATALADNLGRFLAGETVQARPAGPVRRAGNWLRRHPFAAVLLAAAAALLVGSVFHARQLGAVNTVLTTALAERDASTRQYRRAAYADAVRRIDALLERGGGPEAQRLLDEWEPRPGEEELRGWEWHYLSRRSHRGEIARWDVGVTHTLAFRPDGGALAGAGKDGRLHVWDPDTGRDLAPPRPHPDEVDQLVWAPDGSWLATACDDGVVRVWPAAGGPAVELRGHTDKVKDVTVSPDGRTLASCSKDRTVRLWDATDWSRPGRILTKESDGIRTVTFGPNGTILAGGSADGSVTAWDRATGRRWDIHPGHGYYVNVVRAVPGWPGFVSAARDVAFWEPAASEPGGWRRAALPGLEDRVRDLALMADGQTLAVAADSGVTVWDWFNGPLFRCRLYGHRGRVLAVAFHPGARRLATAGADGTVRLWDLYVVRIAFRGPLAANPAVLAYPPDRQVCVSVRAPAWWVQTWGNRDGAPPYTCIEHPGPISGVALAPDGPAVLTTDHLGQVRRWSLDGRSELGPPLFSLPGVTAASNVQHLAVSPDGRRLAAVVGHDIWLVEAATGQRLTALSGHKGPPDALVFSPDGRTLATGGHDHRVFLWDATTGSQRAALPEHDGFVHALAFAPDGRTLASACEDRLIHLWDPDGRSVGRLAGHRGAVHGVAFSPDGRTLASVSADGTCRLWQRATGSELLSFPADRLLTHVAFSPDGRHLAFAGPPGPAHPFPGAGYLESHDCGWPP